MTDEALEYRDAWRWASASASASIVLKCPVYSSRLRSKDMPLRMPRATTSSISESDNLEDAAREARSGYKARKQEQVAKAPVKMMVPTGVGQPPPGLPAAPIGQPSRHAGSRGALGAGAIAQERRRPGHSKRAVHALRQIGRIGDDALVHGLGLPPPLATQRLAAVRVWRPAAWQARPLRSSVVAATCPSWPSWPSPSMCSTLVVARRTRTATGTNRPLRPRAAHRPRRLR